MPVLRPTLEPWLDLELVVDESISMQIWRQTIRDLEKLLKNYGIFRDVRVWGMTAKDGEKVQVRRGIGTAAKNKFPRSSKELIDGSGRRLILVVSDCVSSYWRDGKVTEALEIWANHVPTAIIQMLPKWLWKRTALGRASEVRLRALTPGVSNQNLIAEEVSLWDELEEERGLKIPVFTLETDKAATWAQMLSGKSSVSTLGFVFKLDAPVQENRLFNLDYSQLSAEDRVQAFRVTASPMVRKLAGLLAAAPVISLPVVRLIRGALLRESLQVNVAEVFLGGLLKPLSEIKVETNPDDVLYGFVDGVRELLVDSMPSYRVLNVVDKVSEYLAERVGLSLEDFAAVLRREKEVENSGVVEEVEYFATVTAQVLRRLGGEYVKVADNIEVKNQEPLQKLVREVDHKAFDIEFANLLNPNNPDGSFLLTLIRMRLKQFNLDHTYTEYEIMSEVYLRGVKTLQKGETITNFSAYFRKVSFNYIRELSREKSKSVAALQDYILLEDLVKHNLTEDEDLKFKPELTSTSIALAFKKLTPDEKKLLRYKIIENLSWEKIQSLEEYQDFTLSDLREWKERILKKLRLLYYSVENASEDVVSIAIAKAIRT